MDAVDFAKRLLRAIDEAILPIDRSLVSGSIPDHAAYKAATGRRAGLEGARAIVVKLIGEIGQDEFDKTL
jgi:hypothetical protein